LTLAPVTPGTFATAFSTRATHDAHVMPVIVSSFSETPAPDSIVFTPAQHAVPE
jgi:hypothetical protein